MHFCEVKDLPSLRFIQECRVVLHINIETLKDFKISKVEKWDQEITDGTSRRQIISQEFVVVLLEGEGLKPLILSSIILLGEEISEDYM